MSATSYREEKLAGGWLRRIDFGNLKQGRYCDRCEKRITEGDPYFTKGDDVDLCEPCYEAVK